jgi:hypothetical protein
MGSSLNDPTLNDPFYSNSDKPVSYYDISHFTRLPQVITIRPQTAILEAVNISHLSVPEWRKYDFRNFVFRIGYKRFVDAIDRKNEGVTRREMEALWWATLKKKYATWDPRPTLEKLQKIVNYNECMGHKWDMIHNAFLMVSWSANEFVCVADDG